MLRDMRDMNEALRPAQLDWSQGQPQASDFGDIYFSREDGAAETCHVFLDGNRLGERFSTLAPAQAFTIIETGFGTGLNWLSTQALRAEHGHCGWLHYLSIEKHPLSLGDLIRAHACWPALAEFASALQKSYPALAPGFHRLVFPQWRSTLTLVFADVAAALPRISAQSDAWFLDGFAPSRNPQMWTTELYAGMARLSSSSSSFATFTAAGDVRRGLAAAGFAVEKIPGFGKKREMLRGVFQPEAKTKEKVRTEKPWAARPPQRFPEAEREALIIGAGIAGAATARALALRGWRVNVLEKNTVASAASGNPAAVISLSTAPPGEALDHFPQHAGLHALREFETTEAPDTWHSCGVLELTADNRRKTAASENTSSLPVSHWQLLDAESASKLAGIRLAQNSVWQARSGWLDAAAWCRQLLDHPDISLREGCAADSLEFTDSHWRVLDNNRQELARAKIVIIANSQSARAFSQCAGLPLRPVRGQISLPPKTVASAALKTVICARGYITPALPDGNHCLGASFVPDDESTELRHSEHEENRVLLQAISTELTAELPATATWQGRSSLRCQSPDYLPLVGPLADPAQMQKDYAGLRDGKLLDYPELSPLPGLYINVAHGSHGFSQAALAAEILASELNAEPAPVAQKVRDALHPMRFLIRDIRRGKT